MKALRVAALALLTGLGGCYTYYGEPDPVASGLLGAGVGAVAGAAVASAAQPRTYYYAPPPPPRRFYGPPPAYYGPPRGFYGGPRHYGYGYGRRGW